MRIEHCNGKRRTTVFVLSSRAAGFDREALANAYCPKCKKDIWQHCYWTVRDGFTPLHPIEWKELDDWLARKEADLLYTINPGDINHSRATMYVGDYTRWISRGADPNKREQFHQKPSLNYYDRI
jgi:hypothetical protein